MNIRMFLLIALVFVLTPKAFAAQSASEAPIASALEVKDGKAEAPIPSATEADICCICRCEFEADEKDSLTKLNCCNKNIHSACIKGWYDSGKISCPLCRALDKLIYDSFMTAVDKSDVKALKPMLRKYPFLAKLVIQPKENNTILHYVAGKGLNKVARLLLKFKASVHARNVNKEAPMHFAAAAGCATMIHILAHKRAYVDAHDHMDRTPMHLAAAGGWKDTILALLDHRADKNAVCLGTLHTPVHCAVINNHYDATRTLVLAGANQDLPDHNNKKPKHYALDNKNYRVRNLLR